MSAVKPERTTAVDVVRLPVMVEQQIGELVLDVGGTRSIEGAALVVIADYVNSFKSVRASFTLPLRFSFDSDGGRVSVTIARDE